MEKRIITEGGNIAITVPDNETLDVVILLQHDAVLTVQATLGAHATLNWHTAITGGQVQCDISTIHAGSGSQSQHNGIFLGGQHDKFILNYWSKHPAQDTTGHITIHGVLLDSAYADFKGNVIIPETGRQTTASLTEHTILLGDRARSDSVPQLDIQTNAVQAAHSSGISRIDAEQLFYCASRGLSEEVAKQMIVHGFLQECMDEAMIEDVVNARLNYAQD